MRITVGDTEISMAAGELPEFSYSLLEAIDPSKVRGSSSTTFDIPATNAARVALGGPAINEEVAGEKPFRIGNGSEVLFDGVAVPVEWSDDRISIAVFGDNAEWINEAKNTRCTEVDLGLSEFVENTMQEASWTDTDRADVYPLIDYGSLRDHTSTTNVIEDKLYPAVRVWKLLDTFFKSLGFSLKVDGAFNTIWKKLILPYTGGAIVGPNSEFGGRWLAEASITTGGTPTSPPDPFVNYWIPFPVVDFDPQGYTELSGGNARYWLPDISATYRVRFNGTIQMTGPFSSTQITHRVMLFRVEGSGADELIAQRYFFTPATNGLNTYDFNEILFDAALTQGERYYVAWYAFDGFFPRQITVLAGAALSWDMLSFSGWQAEIIFDIAKSIQPGLTVGDVISDLANIFRLAIRTDQLSNTVTIGYLEDYLKSTDSGIDWRDRMDHTTPPDKVQPEVPDRYVFNYDLDASDFYLVQHRSSYGRELGEGIYNAGGRDQDAEITLKFAPFAEGVRFGGLTVPIVRDERSSALSDFTRIKPRILVFAGLTDGEWTFDGQSLTQYPRAYFVGDGGGDESLAFGNENGRPGTVQRHWRDYLVRIGKPYLRGNLRLYDDEFMNFSFDRPRLVNDGYMDTWMYVQKVGGKRFGDEAPVECELIPV